MSGQLFVVPTPVGNLEDMTLRAVRVLKEADVVLAEDTRTSGVLMKHFQIDKPLKAYHQHNEHKITEELVNLIQQGRNVALISDAGTPGISDPGFFLIRAAVAAGISVTTLPGATAFVPALVSSALPCTAFTFIGFLPQKKGRQTRLKALALEPHTLILYESPYRLVKLLQELSEHLGGHRKAAVCREISKLHEEIARGTLQELHTNFSARTVKGEIVVVVEGGVYSEPTSDEQD